MSVLLKGANLDKCYDTSEIFLHDWIRSLEFDEEIILLGFQHGVNVGMTLPALSGAIFRAVRGLKLGF